MKTGAAWGKRWTSSCCTLRMRGLASAGVRYITRSDVLRCLKKKKDFRLVPVELEQEENLRDKMDHF